MKAFLVSIILVAVIVWGAQATLNTFNMSAKQVYSSSNTRL